MKKTVLTIIAVITVIAANGQYIEIPPTQSYIDSTLYEYTHNRVQDGVLEKRSQKQNGNAVFDILNGFDPSIPDLVSILDNGGEIFNYQMVVKASATILEADVPSGLPDRLKLTSSGTAVRTFNEWLLPGDIFEDSGNVYFYTVNVTGKRLKGSEIRIIAENVAGVEVMTTTDQEFINVLQGQ